MKNISFKLTTLTIICPFKNVNCGVLNYCTNLADNLNQNKVNTVIITDIKSPIESHIKIVDKWNWRGYKTILKYLETNEIARFNIQFVNWMYHKYGIPLLLVFLILNLKQMGVKVSITIHETFVPPISLKWLILHLPQKILLYILILLCDKIIIVNQIWTKRFKKLFFFKKDQIYFLPVFSNIEPKKQVKKPKNKTLHCVTISFNNLAKPYKKIIEIFDQIPQKNKKLIVIGKIDKKIINELSSRKDIEFTDQISDRELANILSRSDLYIGCFADGMSARRTSALAALGAGLPLISNISYHTETLFRKSPIIFYNEKFTANQLAILKSKVKLNKMSEKSLEFYKRYFSQEKITENFIKILKK